MIRPANRNMDIITPVIGLTELRPDLDRFEVPLVLQSRPHFNNATHALLDGGPAWLAQGMDECEIAQNAQFEGGELLGGFLLQRLAIQAEEAYQQYQSRSPELKLSITRNQEPGERTVTDNIEERTITEEWLEEQAETSMNRRIKIGEFFDSAFLSPEVQVFRAELEKKASDNSLQLDNVTHIDSTRKKEI